MRNSFRIPLCALFVAGLSMTGLSIAHSSSVTQQNLADLIEHAEYILKGQITGVSDGIDADGVPYTEVILDVDEAIRGDVGKTFTFRQFGLLQPREVGDGLRNLNVIPAGWARFAEGEDVVVFLYEKASLTGLRTTVGLFQGKFTIDGNQVRNASDNLGLFYELGLDKSRLDADEAKMVDQIRGSIPVDTFTKLVKKAVREKWVETGVMIHEN